MQAQPTKTIRSQTVAMFIGSLKAAGEDVTDVIERFGLPPDVGDSREVVVPFTVEQQLGDAIAEKVGDPFLGLHVVQALPRGAFGLLEFTVRSSPTLREAFSRVVRFGALLDEQGVYALEERGAEAILTYRIPGERLCAGRQNNEVVLAMLVRFVREALESRWTPIRVGFAHPRPADITELERFFGTSRLEFDVGHNYLTLPAAELVLPVRTADEALLSVLDEQAELRLKTTSRHNDPLVRVRQEISRQVNEGSVELGKVAEALGTSRRTLQRRLAESKSTFNALVDEVRCELARSYLASSEMNLSAIAVLLGYSDAATFVRAFKRWVGKTPGEYRKSVRRV